MPKGGPGIKKSPEHIAKIAAALKGKKRSDDQRRKMSGPKSENHKKSLMISANNLETRNRFKKTCLERFGVDHPAKDTKRNNLHVDYWINKGYSRNEAEEIIRQHQLKANESVNPENRKSIWQEKYWVECGFSKDEAKNKVSEIQIKNASKAKTTKSKEATYFLDLVEKYCGKEILRESPVSNFNVDGFIPDHKVVIEYFGSFWHMNPKQYSSDDIHRVTGGSAQSIWNEDSGRIKKMVKDGFKVFRIWDYEATDDKAQEIAKYIGEK